MMEDDSKKITGLEQPLGERMEGKEVSMEHDIRNSVKQSKKIHFSSGDKSLAYSIVYQYKITSVYGKLVFSELLKWQTSKTCEKLATGFV